MTGLIPDLPLIDASLCGAGGEARPERVAGIGFGIVAGGGDPFLHDQAYGLGREGIGEHPPMLVDPAEDRPLADPGAVEPTIERVHRAELGAAEGDADLAALAVLVGL